MADIFISYSQADREWVKKLAAALEAEGLSVWWDPMLLPGTRFRELTNKELEVARAVIVVWSRVSVVSDWVIGEADEARLERKLVPIFMQNVRPPTEFRVIHTSDFSNWRGRPQDQEFQGLLRAIRLLAPPRDVAPVIEVKPAVYTSPRAAGEPRPAPAAVARTAPGSTTLKIGLGALALAIGLSMIFFWVHTSSTPQRSLSPSTAVPTEAQPAAAGSQPPQMQAPVQDASTKGAASIGVASPAVHGPKQTHPTGSQKHLNTSIEDASSGGASIAVPPPEESRTPTPQDSSQDSTPAPVPPAATPADPEAAKQERIKELENAWKNSPPK